MMKKEKITSFLSGVVSCTLVLGLVTTALAATVQLPDVLKLTSRKFKIHHVTVNSPRLFNSPLFSIYPLHGHLYQIEKR